MQLTWSLFILLVGGLNLSRGQRITVTGPLVDKYCWITNNGIAIDTGANLKTNPFKHTIHCLLFSPCLSSGFMVVEKINGAAEYTVKYELNDTTLVAAYLRQIAPSGSARYSAQTGFVISVTGTYNGNGMLNVESVTEAGAGGSSTSPPAMSTTMNSIQSSSAVCGSSVTALQFGVSAQAYADSSSAVLVAHGPSAAWFSVGFGSGMIGAQAIVFQVGRPVVRFLLTNRTFPSFQEQTPSGFTILGDTSTGGVRQVCLLFALPAPSGINLALSSNVSIVFAKGTTPTLGYHLANRGKTVMQVGAIPPSVSAARGLGRALFRVLVCCVGFLVMV